MTMKLWHYLINQFLTKTKTNFRKAVKLSNYHDAVLNILRTIHPELEPIYTRYHALHVILVNKYVIWKNYFDAQKNKTKILDDLLESTYTMLDVWDTPIRTALTYGSDAYELVFMDGRKPFTRGTIQQQVMAYQKLAEKLAIHPALAAVTAEVVAAHAALDAARDLQEGAKALVKTNSGAVETARKVAMIMQWRDLGFAIDAFSNDLKLIESMFDVDTLRERPQTIFTGILSHSENKAVFTRTLLDDDELLLNNDGDADIRFYFADTPNGTNINHIEVLAHTKQTVKMSDFNVPDYGTYRYLTAVNQSALVDTHYIVTIL